ncbi:sigma factor-like helix-turn-helix DNA-binding protein [Kitasatospora azatica]|uniref:sigma factor-like helix-turn-helix DNA-binding protein n=1 Tax=Kitasatospora azatica TaxID=58347 RepID=UPI00068A29BC|nr:sigma factor-like helix-turn-helix DNA-binding protein [Kitasatospora azatica]
MELQLDWLGVAWATLDERSRAVFVARQEGKTLDEIGRAHDFTRERARQILVKTSTSLRCLGDLLAPGWRERVEELDAGIAISRAEIAKALDARDHLAIEAFAEAVGYKPPRTWAGDLQGWWTSSPGALEVLLRDIAAQAPLREGELDKAIAEARIPEAIPVATLLTHARSPLVSGGNGSWLRRRARGRDAAYLWLLEHGAPCRVETMLNPTGFANTHALAEALRRDERFVQLRPEGSWALAEWPGVSRMPYKSAAEVLVDVVGEFGPITKEELFTKVVERYPVTTWRLQQCLLSDQIGTTGEGLIDLVARGAQPNEETEPPRPASMAVNEAGTVYGIRITVDKDVLRGSGILVHKWITWKLGLRRAPMSLTFDTQDSQGPLILRRGTSGAQLSSLRRFVRELGLVLGCELVVLLNTRTAVAQVRHVCPVAKCPVRTAG